MVDKDGIGDNKLPVSGHSLTSDIVHTPLNTLKKTRPLRVLSEADFRHWQMFGYVVVKAAVPTSNVERLVDLLWRFQELDPQNPRTWDREQLRANAMVELNNSGMVELYNHQFLWDNRQWPRVYDAFVDIWDQEKLWVSINRANLNPPNREERPFLGFIHTDVDTTLVPLPVNVQGVLSLVDVDEEIGGFQCVPDLFRNLDDWIGRHVEPRDGFRPDTAGYDVFHVPMNMGDLLIFNSLLPHGIRPNRSRNRVRMAQYISMKPADENNHELRMRRIRSWSESLPPEGHAFPGDPRRWEETRYETAKLTDLGRKLLGLDVWPSARAT
jgi:ectoine hydroxylase-related dioxygenase (phytanoyl-CoA dioxygenase family)